MGKQSIIGVHAEITARATQLVDEYGRADRVSRAANSSIRNELSKTMRHIEKEFAGTKFAKGFLGGLGIGTGMEIARSAMDGISEAMQASARRAKETAQHVEQMREDLREIQGMKFENFIGKMPDGQAKAEVIERRMKEVERQKNAAIQEREDARRTIAALGYNLFTEEATTKFKPDPMGLHKRVWNAVTLQWDKLNVKGQIGEKADAEISKQQKVIDALNKQLDELDARRDKTVEEGAKKRAEAMARWLKPFNDKIEADNKRAIAAADKLRDAIATPVEKLREALKDLPDMLERGLKGLPGGITYDEAQRARAAALRKYEEDSDPSKNAMYQRWEKAAGGLRIDDYTRRGLGTGANYQDVARQTMNILSEIRELLRRAINNPKPNVPAYGA